MVNAPSESKAFPLPSLRFAGWLALVTGLVEATVRAFEKVVLHRTIHTSLHVVWMAPLANLMWIGVPGLALWVGNRWWPRVVTTRVIVFSLTFIAFAALVNLYPSMGFKANVILAIGLAVRTSSIIADRAEAMAGLVNRSLRWVVLLITVLGCGAAAWSPLREARLLSQSGLPSAAVGTPNVLLLVLDTVRGFNLSLYGYPRETSPFLTRYAKTGVRFDRAISTAPWTLPSHGSMMTGRFAHELGTSNIKPLDETFPTLAEELSARGYATGGFVANLAFASYEMGLARGFMHYEDHVVSPGEVVMSSSMGRLLLDRSSLRAVLRYYSDPNRRNATEVDAGFLRWAEKMAQRKRPFFAFLNYLDAHAPYIPPEGYEQRFAQGPNLQYHPRWLDHTFSDVSSGEIQWDLQQYDATLSYLDDEINRLLQELERLGILGNTIVVVTADHGDQFGEHQLISHGNSLYRQLLQVPLIICYPGRIPHSVVVNDLVSLRDIPATILDLAGLGGKSRLPGASLARFWRPTGGAVDTPIIASEILTGGSDGPFSVIADGRHYVRWFQGQEELYDMNADPTEVRNLAAGQAAAELPRFRALLDSIVGRPVARIRQNPPKE